MSIQKNHGKRTYTMAWVVEFSLFGMALMLAVFNLVTGWDSGSVTLILQAILLAIGWIGIACIELSTIPLAGSLALTRWRDKPINITAVLGLTMLSAWTVYEFNEAGSYYMTREAREAVIQNENDEERIIRNTEEIAQIETSVATSGERLATARMRYEEAVAMERNRSEKQLENFHIASKSREKSILDRIEQLEKKRRGNPALVTKVDELTDRAEVAKADHHERHESLIKARQQTIDNLETEITKIKQEQVEALDKAEKERAALDTSTKDQITTLEGQLQTMLADVKELRKERDAIETGPFTGGAERKDKMDKEEIQPLEEQIALIRSKIQDLGDDVRSSSRGLVKNAEIEALTERYATAMDSIKQANADIESIRTRQITGPDISAVMAEIQQINRQLEVERVQRHEEYERAVTPLNDELITLRAEMADRQEELLEKSASIMKGLDDAYQTEVTTAKELVGNRDSRIDALKQASAKIRTSIVERTETVDAASEPILYYRMAKWFQEGDGLPTKEDYTEAQAKIFAPLGIFYGIVSIALAYIGTVLRVRPEIQTDATDRGQSDKRSKRLRKLEKKALQLEEKCAQQSIDLVHTRQAAFEAIKQVPQVFTMERKESERSNLIGAALPWVACILMAAVTTFALVGNRTASTTPEYVTIPAAGTETLTAPQPAPATRVFAMDEVMNPVVMIQTESGIGSGFFVQSDGMIVTNAHVVGDEDEVQVATRQGPTHLGSVVARDTNRDLALVKIEVGTYPTLDLSSVTDQDVGLEVLAIGTPLGLEWSVSKGIISSVRSKDDMTLLQTDAAVNFGNSGGPLVDLSTGKVIGVNTLKANDKIADGIGFAVSSDEIRKAFPTHSWYDA